MINKGVPVKNIIVLEEWNRLSHQAQYFEARCIDCKCLRGGMVDAGAYDGMDTVLYAF